LEKPFLGKSTDLGLVIFLVRVPDPMGTAASMQADMDSITQVSLALAIMEVDLSATEAIMAIT